MAKTNNNYRLIVVGAGMIGSLAACLAAARGIKTALIDPQPARSYSKRRYDLRVSAINPQSQQMLEQLQLWDGIVEARACPYQRLRVFSSDSGSDSGGINFYAADYGVESLGHIIENSLITQQLQQQLLNSGGEVIAGTVEHLDAKAGLVQLADSSQLQADIVVLAAGYNPQLLNQLDISTRSFDYQQAALVFHVGTAYSQQDITWQRFDSEGAQAFLPLVGYNASLVWYLPQPALRDLLALKPAALRAQLLNSYPQQLGEITGIKAHASFKLSCRHSYRYYRDRCVLAGDSIHSISPIAGLGANLGFADLHCLFEQFDRFDLDPERAYPQYQLIRRRANSQIITAVDLIHKSFQPWQFPFSSVRSHLLNLADWLPPVKKILWQQASYLQGLELKI